MGRKKSHFGFLCFLLVHRGAVSLARRQGLKRFGMATAAPGQQGHKPGTRVTWSKRNILEESLKLHA